MSIYVESGGAVFKANRTTESPIIFAHSVVEKSEDFRGLVSVAADGVMDLHAKGKVAVVIVAYPAED